MSCGVSRQSGGGSGIFYGFTQAGATDSEHLLGPNASYAPITGGTHCATAGSAQSGGRRRGRRSHRKQQGGRRRGRRTHRKHQQHGGTHYTFDFAAPRVGGMAEVLSYSPQCGAGRRRRSHQRRK